MSYMVRSARGEQVDFDLLKIKQEMMGINTVDVSTSQPITKTRAPAGNIVPARASIDAQATPAPEGWVNIDGDAGEFDEENTDPIPDLQKTEIKHRK